MPVPAPAPTAAAPPARPGRPVRVLHVVGAMDRGGVETWLMNVLRTADPARVRQDFLVHRAARAAYDDEIEALGGRLIRCSRDGGPLAYGARFLRALRANGPYDVVHSHVFWFSGWVLALARLGGVPRRIAHCHTGGMKGPEGGLRRAYERAMRALIGATATGGFGISETAGKALFGPGWHVDPRWELLLYGFDFSRYRGPVDRAAVRARFAIPAGRKLVGHVGRFSAVKNHEFLVRAFRALVDRGCDAHLLLVGGGELEEAVRRQVADLGLGDRVTLAGVQSDVPLFLRSMDLMLFPSHYEGLGIVLLEAQAAGIPTLASAAVPPEAAVVPGLVEYRPLADGAEAWATAAERLLGRAQDASALAQVENSGFGMARCLARLMHAYGAD